MGFFDFAAKILFHASRQGRHAQRIQEAGAGKS
jgi:hypothetical protein